MGRKDSEIRAAIESMLESGSSGRRLKDYFDALPDKRVRRAIGILSGIYPDKTAISDDDFSFVTHMFSDVRFMGQESFSGFVRAVNILSFTDRQKELLIDSIKNNIEILCSKCTFELDALLVSLFEPGELLRYLEALTGTGSPPVLQRVFALLLYEDFLNGCGSDEKIEALKQKISESQPEA